VDFRVAVDVETGVLKESAGLAEAAGVATAEEDVETETVAEVVGALIRMEREHGCLLPS